MTGTAAAEVMSIRCPRCREPIEITSIPTMGEARCALCGRAFQAVRFEPPSRAAVVPQMVDGTLDAAQPCANHPGNAAVTSCQRCGSFICALCRIDLDNRTLCPTCFERLSAEGSLESTRTTFRDYPGLAGVTATVGCLISALGFLFGPLAIYYGIKGLKQKKEMGESDGLVGLRVAIVIGSLESIGGALFMGFFIYGMLKR